MNKLEFLIENSDYANINDYDYVEGQFRIKDGDWRLAPLIPEKGYYKNSLEAVKGYGTKILSSKRREKIIYKVRRKLNALENYYFTILEEDASKLDFKVLVKSFQRNPSNNYEIKFRFVYKK
ncbi:MAG: hypothetical protein AABW56_05575 [Nanoarchaeota archaeon]